MKKDAFVSAAWHASSGNLDVAKPPSGVIRDDAGHLYSTTFRNVLNIQQIRWRV